MAAQHAGDEADIRQRIDQLVQAVRALDLEGVKPVYAPGIVSFDMVPPLQHVWAEAKWNNWADVFTVYQRPLGYEDSAISHHDAGRRLSRHAVGPGHSSRAGSAVRRCVLKGE